MIKEMVEKSTVIVTDESYKQIVTSELESVGSGGKFVWSLFFLCVLPNILNGFHVNSYTMLGHLPDDQWCDIDDLKATNWTVEEIRSIAQKNLISKGCTVWDWDYQQLSKMSYTEAYNFTSSMLTDNFPTRVACKDRGSYRYESPENTFVADWDLVCDRALQRTSAQVFLSVGKLCGSFSFGIFSDRFGRKSAFTLGCGFFIISSLFCTFAPWYWLFLLGRFGLGAASSGLFYPAFAMMVENICLKHRSWMSIAFSGSYPIGMIVLALTSYFVEPWRYLQLCLTAPAFLLILNCYLMDESPRWLITRKRYAQAYCIVFNKKSHYELKQPAVELTISADKKSEDPDPSVSLWSQLKEGPLKQIAELFATSKLRKLILTSYFMFCVTSLSYYITALNASNLAVSRYLYVGITGMVDLPSYLVPVIMLHYTGRRITTMALFYLTGIALLLVLAIPEDSTSLIVCFAMLGRFGISATYSVLTLYTAELYPTEIRNSALGTCSTWAHVGSISAPYAVDLLGPLGWYIPTTICGGCVLVAGLLTLVLPETAKNHLSDRVEQIPSAKETNFTTADKSKS